MRRLHNEEFHSLYCSSNIRVIKSRRLRWAGHVLFLLNWSTFGYKGNFVEQKNERKNNTENKVVIWKITNMRIVYNKQ